MSRAGPIIGACMVTLITLLAPTARAANVDFTSQIKPIFAARCTMCHGALKQQSKLRLDAGTLALKGGKHGAVITPGKSDASILVHAISGGANGTAKMPEEGDPLKPEEIALIRQWIDEGAKTPADEAIPSGPESHWAFKRPERPAVPGLSDVADPQWVRNPIDAFVSAEHKKRGLVAKSQADKGLLLRRVTLDLTGLPPTREELRAFLDDDSSDAYEKIVDRLLASPRYGERWGRHWMDVWRYSDWAGFGGEVRFSQPHIWRWRDWIIESLNADKPYDQMVREMIAGDEIAPADPKTLRATGFLARNWSLYNRVGWLDEAVEHTGKAFLGMTFNCAKCHDHMFDPVSQKEFFGLRAIFEPYGVRTDQVPGVADTKVDGIARVFDLNAAAPTYLFIRGDDRNPKKDEPIAPVVPASLGGKYEIATVNLPPAGYYPGLSDDVRKGAIAAADAAVTTAEKSMADLTANLAAAQANYTTLTAPPPPPPPIATTQPTAAPVIADTFAAARPELWQPVNGKWEFSGGKLTQSELGGEFRTIRAIPQLPADFTARVQFTIAGGGFRSVGFSYDVTDAGDEEGAYLTAHEGGARLSTFERTKGSPVYDGAGTLPLPVALNIPYELRVDARGDLVNVYVNEVLAIAHRLKKPRQPGRLTLWTYDAAATFTSARVDALPSDAKLFEKVATPPTTIQPLDPKTRIIRAATTLRTANEQLAAAKLKRDIAKLDRAALDAKITADRAKYATPPAVDAEALALTAGQAERQANVAKAELNVLTAQHALAAAQISLKASDAESIKKLTEAGTKLVEQSVALIAARETLNKPSPQYAPITMTYPKTSTGRRLALAKWITDRSNPLAARVAVNHIWMHHLGTPIVPTVFDFGLNGRAPSNQALLDWLAVELMDRGWSMKAIHRLIVTSSTYRMRSEVADADGENRKVDPDNLYYWRANTRRMEAETVRDSLLFAAGNLDLTTGGPDLDHEQGLVSTRRSIYFRNAHEKQMTFLKVFDGPNPNECYRRIESVMPQQALALANSSLALAESRRLASKITQQLGSAADPRRAFITAAFEQLLSRAPSEQEVKTCEDFLAEQAKRLIEPAKLKPYASGEASTVPASSDPNQRARENLVHVLINHNDFVTIR